jgi:hypothetical protein
MGKTSYKSSTLFCIFNAKVRVALFDSALGGFFIGACGASKVMLSKESLLIQVFHVALLLIIR